MGKKMLFYISLLAVLLCFAAGCADDSANTPTDGSMPTVENIFSRPEDYPSGTEDTAETAGTAGSEKEFIEFEQPRSLMHGPTDDNMQKDAFGTYYVYEGGEMHLQYQILADGLSTTGVGILLFLDGQPQPYKTASDGTCSYIHTFYPADKERLLEELIFTPVTGEKGDELELYMVSIQFPDYFPFDGIFAFPHTSGSTAAGTRLKFSAARPAAELPEINSRILSQNVYYEDLPYGDTAGWSDTDLMERVESNFTVNGHTAQDSNNLYGITAEAPVELNFELWGSPYVNYGLVFFVNNVPVSAAADDLLFLDVKNGQKTVVEAAVDISDFNGEGVVYGILVPRNYYTSEVLTRAFVSESRTYYLCGADSYEQAMGLE